MTQRIDGSLQQKPSHLVLRRGSDKTAERATNRKWHIPMPLACASIHTEPKATLHLTNIKGREGRGKGGKEGSRLVVPGNFMPLSAGNDSSEHTKSMILLVCAAEFLRKGIYGYG